MGMATIDDEAMEPEVTAAPINRPPIQLWYFDSCIRLDETPVNCEPKAKRKLEGKRTCKADQGERTNRKLKDQPYYHRGRKGKPKGY